jgi:hypothetical protein
MTYSGDTLGHRVFLEGVVEVVACLIRVDPTEEIQDPWWNQARVALSHRLDVPLALGTHGGSRYSAMASVMTSLATSDRRTRL